MSIWASSKFLVSNKYLDTFRSASNCEYLAASNTPKHWWTLHFQDARRRKQEIITVRRLDPANAYASASHNLIQFAAEWYHVLETVRDIIHSYYDDLAVKIAAEDWTTD